MLRHYFLLSFRNIIRFKTTSAINLLGLSMGLVSALFIHLWVNDELNIDKFHQHDARLYQLMLRNDNATGIEVWTTMAPVLAETLVDEIPEVEHAVMESRIPGTYTFTVDNNSFKEAGMYAGQDYFEVFSYELIHGKKNEPLVDENNIAISRPMAMRLFNTTEDILGKVITLQDKGDLVVSGVFSVPSNSSYQFDFILPFDLQFKHYPNLRNDWSNSWANAYVILKEGASPKEFNQKIEDLIKQKAGQEDITLFSTRYSKRYLYGEYENGIQSGGRIEYVKMFSIIAIFIVVIACINFMNLATANSSRRLKEIGVKKVMGVDRKALIFQYLIESVAMAVLSAFVAIILILILLPQFNIITGKALSLNLDGKLIIAVFSITLVTGLIAGSYPALYLSGFNPVAVLKGRLHTSFSEILIRRGLVVFQFVLSVTLITGVLVIYKQIDLIQNQNPGFTRDNIIYFEREGKLKERLETFLTGVKQIPGVINASSTFLTFFGDLNSTPDVFWPGKDPQMNIDMQYRRVNYDLIELLDIKMEAGKPFSRTTTSDNPKIVFNETAIQQMGISDPIGKTVKVWGDDMEIIGVTEDFHFESLHQTVKPMFFFLNPERTNIIMVRLKSDRLDQTIEEIQKYYGKFVDHIPLTFRFLDEKFQEQYEAEKKVALLSRFFAGLAIIISCMGLYGLVMFAAERKTKEIGIRKILGSSNWGIIYYLTSGFTKMVLVAVALALPASYWISKDWLNNFAYRIELEWWIFAGAGIIAVLIAWLTIGVQASKAAHTDPVRCLRTE